MNFGYLEHDSYVELKQLFQFPQVELNAALAHKNNPLGRMTPSEAYLLAMTARRAATLSQERRDIVWENLRQIS